VDPPSGTPPQIEDVGQHPPPVLLQESDPVGHAYKFKPHPPPERITSRVESSRDILWATFCSFPVTNIAPRMRERNEERIIIPADISMNAKSYFTFQGIGTDKFLNFQLRERLEREIIQILQDFRSLYKSESPTSKLGSILQSIRHRLKFEKNH
jgi:hypothetical protein